MISKTRMLDHVKSLRWQAVESALAESPELIGLRDDRGRNWLHVCCGVNPKTRKLAPAASIRTADVLLAAGLDLDGEAFREGSWKATPLWYAVSRGENPALVKHLLKRGANPNHCLWSAAFKDDVAMIRLLVGAGAEVDPVAEDETPFLAAVKNSHFRAAQALLELGANVDFQDQRGMTALHYMLKKGSDEGHFRMLVTHRPRGDVPNRDGVTAAEIMERKRSPVYRKLAMQLSRAG